MHLLVLFAHAGHLVQSGKHNSLSLVAFLLHLSLVECELLPLLQAAAQPLHMQPRHPASRLPLRNTAAITEQTRFLEETKLRPTGTGASCLAGSFDLSALLQNITV